MSLHTDLRWAREMAAKEQRHVNELESESWQTRTRIKREIDLDSARLKLRLAEEMLALHNDPEWQRREIDLAKKSRDTWIQLAEGYEDRIMQSGEPTLEDA